MENKLGQYMRERRKAQGLTLEQVAKRSGVGVPRICEYELGKRSPTSGPLLKICKAIGVDILEELRK